MDNVKPAATLTSTVQDNTQSHSEVNNEGQGEESGNPAKKEADESSDEEENSEESNEELESYESEEEESSSQESEMSTAKEKEETDTLNELSSSTRKRPPEEATTMEKDANTPGPVAEDTTIKKQRMNEPKTSVFEKDVGAFDVLCGKKSERKAQNLARKLTRPKYDEWTKCTNKEQFYKDAFSKVVEQGGKFLEHDASVDGVWNELEEESAVAMMRRSFENWYPRERQQQHHQHQHMKRGTISKQDLQELDILCGKKSTSMPQNMKKALVSFHLKEYAEATNKSTFCEDLYSEVVGKGGRFLIWQGHGWIMLDKEKAVTKLLQSFANSSKSSVAADQNSDTDADKESENIEDESDMDKEEEYSLTPPVSSIRTIRSLRPKDILCGRKGLKGSHMEHSVFTKVTVPHCGGFKRAKNKKKYCQSIAAKVVADGGRFLRQSTTDDGWVEVPLPNVNDILYSSLRSKQSKANSKNTPPIYGVDGMDEVSLGDEEQKMADRLNMQCTEFDQGGGDSFQTFAIGGGIGKTLKALEQFADSGTVQCNGLAVLCKVAAAEKAMIVALKCADKCIALATLAMEQFSNDVHVHMNAMELAGLLWDAATDQDEKASKLIPFVAEALESNCDFEDVDRTEAIKQGLVFLWQVAGMQGGRDVILNSRCTVAIQKRLLEARNIKLKKDMWALQQRIMQGFNSLGERTPDFNAGDSDGGSLVCF